MTRSDEAFLKELRARLLDWQRLGGSVRMDGDEVVLFESDGDEAGRLARDGRRLTEEVHEAVRHIISELNGRKPN